LRGTAGVAALLFDQKGTIIKLTRKETRGLSIFKRGGGRKGNHFRLKSPVMVLGIKQIQ